MQYWEKRANTKLHNEENTYPELTESGYFRSFKAMLIFSVMLKIEVL